MVLLALMAIVVYPPARSAWGVLGAVVVTAVGVLLLFRFGLLALPYLAVGLLARRVAMQRVLREGESESGHPPRALTGDGAERPRE